MDSSVSPKDEIWFLRVCHHVSNELYLLTFQDNGTKRMSTEELEKPFGLNKELQTSETIMQFRAEDMGTDRQTSGEMTE
jgi:hypothetical protein